MKDIKQLERYLDDFTPMINGVKKRLAYKWFALEADDVGSLVNLAILKLWRKNKNENFVLTKNTLLVVSERAIIKQICQASNVEVTIKEDETGKRKKNFTLHPLAYLDAVIEDDLTLGDMIADGSPSIEDILISEMEFQERKAMVLKVISERVYKQLCFEYENKCVSQENLNLIQKIKKEIKEL